MLKIPEDIIEDVNIIVKELIHYENKNNLSWIQAYKDTLINLNMQNKKEDIKLLTNVVRKISILGYNIIDKPFKLEKINKSLDKI